MGKKAKRDSVMVEVEMYPVNHRALERVARNAEQNYDDLLNEAVAQLTGVSPAGLAKWRKSNG